MYLGQENRVRSVDSPTTSSSIESSLARKQDDYLNDPQYFPVLVANAWKFKILRRYLTKGKMDLRVMSIGVMDISLVEIWKQYNEANAAGKHPVMRYLADFLLDGLTTSSAWTHIPSSSRAAETLLGFSL